MKTLILAIVLLCGFESIGQQSAIVSFRTNLYDNVTKKSVGKISSNEEVLVVQETDRFKSIIIYKDKQYLIRSDALKLQEQPDKKQVINYQSLEYTNYCLDKFRRNQLSAIGLVAGGGILAYVGVINEQKEIITVGTLISVSGLFVHLNSYKWLKNAYIAPAKNGLTAGLLITF
jgi:hypothetical protein